MTGRDTAVLEAVLAAVDSRQPRAIAAAISRLVRDGTLPPGTRLPTVRELSAHLGVSPATVSGAWRALADVGLISSHGRAGTLVREESQGWLTPRYRDLATPLGAGLDLATGAPDPALLPDLAPVLARVGAASRSGYGEAPVLPALERELRTTWPFAPEAMTVVDGAMDAMSRTLGAVVRFGDRVIVENPGFPPLLDLLDHLGVERVPVDLDAHGLRPDLLHDALACAPTAVMVQPRAHNPTGVSMSAARARELATVLARHPDAQRTVVVEDDHSGAITTAPDVSLGAHLPGRVVHIRSFSKSHGPDLRMAALGGPARIVDAVVARRMLGPGWTSRMFQRALLEMLTGSVESTTVAEARRTYRARRRALAAALATHGLDVPPGDGITMWLPVADEEATGVQLAAAGIRVASGAPFAAGSLTPHVRVCVGQLREGFDEVGALLARAASAT